jgi:L-2,4-diaminobutyric acid acetyltransferase
MLDGPTSTPLRKIELRKPAGADGAAVWALIKDCAPLDVNSMYCNMIQCDHFSDTCVIATIGDDVVGWVSGYLVPEDPEALFVWQVAVSEKARGQGLGRKMLQHLLERDACAAIQRIQTTITRDNDASWGLFSGFADRKGAQMDSAAHFKKHEHFQGEHATEHMVTITFRAPMRQAA